MKKLCCFLIGLLVSNIAVAQNVGIGTGAPTARLHVNGTLKVVDGTQGAGKVLTSNAAGLASWQVPSSSTETYYPAVSICCQSWMTKNLDVDTYRNGDAIPHVTDPVQWISSATGAYCYFNNDSATYAATYGKLYNWYAVNDPRGLAPEGWHIASHFEWLTLADCLGGDSIAGGLLKEFGFEHWYGLGLGANNFSGFTALPGGCRAGDGSFLYLFNDGYWWSTAEYDLNEGWYRNLNYNSDILYHSIFPKLLGFSVRCIKD